ncbi:MAG TPA: GNAT family N-acetyltransferase [Candidatus Cloacimonetes bacterium]|nr:GNAT family N-acetyltransferase [Candidatus Cloacimonadota bacterium]HEX37983.1 GNAT family N-acetyltransferase [Candidatus Cloacimonadota bacterium]
MAEKGGEIIGSVMVTHDGREGWLNRLAVLKEFRNKSIAQ